MFFDRLNNIFLDSLQNIQYMPLLNKFHTRMQLVQSLHTILTIQRGLILLLTSLYRGQNTSIRKPSSISRQQWY